MQMDYSETLGKLKEHAHERDLDVTWSDVRAEKSDLLDDLSPYHRRRVATKFESWITRERAIERRG